MRIRYMGHFGQLSGYAMAGYEYLVALQKAGAELDIRLYGNADLNKVPDRFKFLNQYTNSQTDGWPEYTIVHAVPDQLIEMSNRLPRVGKRVALTTWETDRLPRTIYGFPAALAFNMEFHLVLVPCAWNGQAFYNAGIKNVKVLPHCFDPEWWFVARQQRHSNWSLNYTDTIEPEAAFRKRVADSYKQPYTFYSILTWAERKSPILLLKAFLTAFSHDENVKLRIITPTYDVNEVLALARNLGLPELPPVEFVTGRHTDAEMRQLHFDADCYITLARGEGWGLGAFEAMLAGNAVIAPNYGAFPDYLSFYDETYWVECFNTPAVTTPTVSKTEINAGGLILRPVLLNTPSGIRGDQMWAEPDLNTTKSNMRLVYEGCFPCDYTDSRDQLKIFNHETIGARFMRVLERA